MSSSSMSAGDPPPFWNYNYPQGVINDLTPVDLSTINRRLEQLEKIILQTRHEQKIREDNPFVRELYDQYKVALALLEDPDE